MNDHKQSQLSWLASSIRLKAHALRRGVDVVKARAEKLSFLEYVIADEANRPLVVDTFTRLFVEAWRSARQDLKHLSFTAPPGCGKSVMARALLLDAIGHNPHLRTVITSADVGDSANAVNLCREILLTPAYREVFPRVEPDVDRSMDARGWKMGEWYLRTPGQRKDPTMLAKAAQPKAEAIRVDMLLADDIVTERTFEGIVHERLVRAFFNTWIEGRLSNGGWCCYLQNVRGKRDLLHRLKTKKKFTSVWITVAPDCERMVVRVWNPPRGMRFVADPHEYGLTPQTPQQVENPPAFEATFPLPNRVNSNGQPSIISSKELLLQVEPTSLKTLYQGIGLDPDDLMLPHWGKTLVRHDKTVAELLNVEDVGGMPCFDAIARNRFSLAAGLDLSGQKRRGMAFWIVARDASGRKYPVVHWKLRCTLNEVIQRIDFAFNVLGLHFAMLEVENNGVQDTIREAIKHIARQQSYAWADRVLGFQTGSNKWDPQLGLPSIDVELANGVWQWPAREALRNATATDATPYGFAPSPQAEHFRGFEDALSEVTRDITRTTAPDELMAFWFADSGLNKSGTPGGYVAPMAGSRAQNKAQKYY